VNGTMGESGRSAGALAPALLAAFLALLGAIESLRDEYARLRKYRYCGVQVDRLYRNKVTNDKN